jgi:general secretion pathway protein E
MFEQKIMLGELLENKGLVSREEFDSCLAQSKEEGKRVGDILIDKGYLTEEQVYRALAEQRGVDYIDLIAVIIDQRFLQKFSVLVVEKNQIVPIVEDDEYITVAFKDPTDIDAQDTIQRMFTKKILKVVTANPLLVDRFVHQLKVKDSIAEILTEVRKEVVANNTIDIEKMMGVDKLVRLIMEQAIGFKSSDIHIEPYENGSIVRNRIDGILTEAFSFDADIFPPLSSKVKLMANMDIAEKRKPQDGRITTKILGKEYDFRVSTLPTTNGESLVLRILDKTKVLINIEDLGMHKDNLRKFTKALKQPFGIILVTGPTGSGKTTTLYSALNVIKGVDKKIITVEDPVEYTLSLIQQVHVNEKAGLTFANALRSILRQDPDDIMIGEIRDEETLRIAIQAALTGHLVLSTLHTNDAISAINRMIDMGMESYLLGSALTAVVAQRLVRRLCNTCKKEVNHAGIPSSIMDLLPKDAVVFRAHGCDKCFGTGYAGREMISEVLTITEDLGAAISRGADAVELGLIAKNGGFAPMFDDGMHKVAKGISTIEEIYRVARV